MLALPPAPAPARKRSLFVGTSVAVAAASVLYAALLGTYLQVRDLALTSGTERFLGEAVVPEIAANMVLVTVPMATIMAQWAVYAMRRGARNQAALALGLVVVLGFAILNSQAFIWSQMGVGIADSQFGPVFYVVTGTFFGGVILGMTMAAIAGFRTLGGRYATNDTEGLSSHALYWYFLTAAYTALWFVVYVNK
jgi:cytochrome c oxidase subunit 3